MADDLDCGILSNDTLLDIVQAQTEIVKLGIDLSGGMDLVVEHILRLTGCSGAVGAGIDAAVLGRDATVEAR